MISRFFVPSPPKIAVSNIISPVIALYIAATISSTAPPITDVGISEFLRGGIFLLSVLPTKRLPVKTAKSSIQLQTSESQKFIIFVSFANVFISVVYVNILEGAEAFATLKLIDFATVVDIQLVPAKDSDG